MGARGRGWGGVCVLRDVMYPVGGGGVPSIVGNNDLYQATLFYRYPLWKIFKTSVHIKLSTRLETPTLDVSANWRSVI